MNGKLKVFLKAFLISFAISAVLYFAGFIDKVQMLNMALPGIFMALSFAMLAKYRANLLDENKKKEKSKKK